MRIREAARDIQRVDAQSDQFAQLQRQYFQTSEKYLDAAEGFSPFKDSACCDLMCTILQKGLEPSGWAARHFVVMPNHLHLLLFAESPSPLPLRRTIPRLKGLAAHEINQRLSRRGTFWQSDWFDRWIRDAAELQRTIDYIRNNPVKAGIVRNWKDYRWVQ